VDAKAQVGVVGMNWQDRIVLDPAVLDGKPIVKGTRIAVALVVNLLAEGWTEVQVLENYPGLTRDDVAACLAYASARLQNERVYPLRAS
jgi:uncharacterized protein (DUF433 family)